jgi:uncharacterized SAM-binding protein YcdF (DUF218 family)
MFVLSKIFEQFGSPSTIIMLLILAGGFIMLRSPGSRWGRRLLGSGFVLLVAFAVFPLGVWMTRALENRFPRPDPMPAHVDGIIVLGGGISVDRSVDHGVVELNQAGDRLTTFVILARQYPDAKLVFTGGNADPFVKKVSEAALAGTFFKKMGLEASRIVYESQSRNTHENALYSYRLVHPRAGERWLMVTTAADVPRAVGCFESLRWAVIPVPVDYRTVRGLGMFPGLLEGLDLADWSTHEWIGLVYYRLRGWTPELFPGPRA